jgi:hypothetical protein
MPESGRFVLEGAEFAIFAAMIIAKPSPAEAKHGRRTQLLQLGRKSHGFGQRCGFLFAGNRIDHWRQREFKCSRNSGAAADTIQLHFDRDVMVPQKFARQVIKYAEWRDSRGPLLQLPGAAVDPRVHRRA